ncbi:hypothetical protein RFI_31642, partial [Reticulomyxa filosa]
STQKPPTFLWFGYFVQSFFKRKNISRKFQISFNFCLLNTSSKELLFYLSWSGVPPKGTFNLIKKKMSRSIIWILFTLVKQVDQPTPPCGSEEYNVAPHGYWKSDKEVAAGMEIEEGDALQVLFQPIFYSWNTTYRFVLCQSGNKGINLEKCIPLSSVLEKERKKRREDKKKKKKEGKEVTGQSTFELNLDESTSASKWNPHNRNNKHEDPVEHELRIPKGIHKLWAQPLESTVDHDHHTLPMTLIFEWV